MKYRIVLRALGLLAMIISLTMIFPLIWSLVDGSDDVDAFISSIGIGLMLGLLLFFLGQSKRDFSELNVREAFAVVSLAWIIASFIGAFPYYFSGALPSFTDSFFEAMSGFSTTGATVFAEIEGNPRGLLFWRNMTQWLGGMGIIVLSLAILPFIGVGGMQLFRAEVPGPTPEKLTPRIQQTAMLLWGVYLLLTALETVLLMVSGLDLFNALTHSFSTVATGGFSPKNASIGAFNSPLIEWIVAVFIFLAGTNFVLHLLALRGKLDSFWKDEEFRFYVKYLLICIVIVTGGLMMTNHYDSFEETVRRSVFQVLTIMTGTGYTSTNYDLWPQALRFLLLLLMFSGGCAGSTAGAIKQMRLLILFKRVKVEIRRLLHPQQILRVRFNNSVLSLDVVSSVTAFYILYMALFVVFSFVMIAFGLDLESGMVSVAATLGNVGPGLGSVGPMENYQFIAAPGKWLLSFSMLLGRLELFSVVMLFVKGTWRQ